jgi:hypothetical protein
MTDKLQTLLDLADENDQVELKMAHNARIMAMKAYQSRPGKQTAEDKNATRVDFEETVSRIWTKHHPQDAPAPEGERFANRKQALNWLHAQGYKVSQGKFYGDCNAGYPAIHRDGTISRFQVLQYAQQQDVERRSFNGAGELSEQEQELKIRKLQNEVRRQDREESLASGRVIERDLAEQSMRLKILVVYEKVAAQFRRDQEQIIHRLGLPPKKAAQFVAEAVGCVDRAFLDMRARKHFDVMIGVEDDAAES